MSNTKTKNNTELLIKMAEYKKHIWVFQIRTSPYFSVSDYEN